MLKPITSSLWLLGLSLVVGAACAPAVSGALGPQGYEQSLIKYRLNYADAAGQKFLPDEWMLDNYDYDAFHKKWHEKKGDRYRAERRLDEDGDGTISSSEKKQENIFDLRFVNSRDNSVIWLKVHPLSPTYAGVDLDVILDDYANGLEGTGLFEQSTLFGIVHDKARHFTTFVVKREPTALGDLPAIRGVIEIADVEKLRLDTAHRDSKAELLFAKVTYLERLGIYRPSSPRWPIVVDPSYKGSGPTTYCAQRTGLLVIGYYNDAMRFDSHLADLHALQSQLVIPESAVPPNSAPAAPATAAPAAPVATERATPAAPAATAAPVATERATPTAPPESAVPPSPAASTSTRP